MLNTKWLKSLVFNAMKIVLVKNVMFLDWSIRVEKHITGSANVATDVTFIND